MPQSKTQTGKLNKKSKPIGTVCCIQIHLIKQGHTKTQRVGGRLINQMESKKKKGVVTFVSDKIVTKTLIVTKTKNTKN